MVAVEEKQLRVLDSPEEFRETLMELFANCKQRAVISCLYIGDGPIEQVVIDRLAHAAEHNNDIRVEIVTDFWRSLRNFDATKKTFAALPARRTRWFLFRTAPREQMFYWAFPRRWREAFGVMHVKAFVVDDAVIITGANLQESYLTNRQDRYIVVQNKELADRIVDIIRAIQRCSYVLDGGGRMRRHAHCPNPAVARAKFLRHVSSELAPFRSGATRNRESVQVDETEIDCALQFGAADPPILDAHSIAENVIAEACAVKESRLEIMSPYFNPTGAITRLLQRTSASRQLHLTTAAPEANSFLHSRGVSRFVPMAYNDILKGICREVNTSRLKVWQFARSGWTFHGKGIWHDRKIPDGSCEVTTIIGSTNFNRRSQQRDLELCFRVSTRNSKIADALRGELAAIHKWSIPLPTLGPAGPGWFRAILKCASGPLRSIM
eukprot:Polyplicarium_translucidae@DN2696_c0_g1_i1.p1